jgi:hypothetical protein
LPALLYFLFSPPHIFFNSNKRSDSRAQLKNKLNKRVILASRTLAHLQAAQADTQTQACKRANFANAPTNNDVSYLICQAYPDFLTTNDNFFLKTEPSSQLSFVSLLSGLS